MMNFENKTIIITGASSGIGKATAIEFAKRKANLILISRNQNKLEETKKECEKKGAKTKLFICDVSKKEQVEKTCNKISIETNQIDILINNAGHGKKGRIIDQSIEEIENQMKTNYFGMMYFTKFLVPKMKAGSHIVNISSIVGLIPWKNHAAYVASKYAVTGFSETIAQELKEQEIQVHIICPNGTKTNFFGSQYSNKKVDTSKMQKPEEITKAIIKSIEKNELISLTKFGDGIIMRLHWLWPKLFHKLLENAK
ncbi:MAG: alcohol dehydrogenase [Candidatus Diapherotrites archaeon CG11_big_fil_rev_8_21_14_0_20_37_9]|nr:MAG: alcohol dehydrogenase [Candidatus Diapherotrites archaeon CG11_big_fil_rev_8_21_14_0_20_37_9]